MTAAWRFRIERLPRAESFFSNAGAQDVSSCLWRRLIKCYRKTILVMKHQFHQNSICICCFFSQPDVETVCVRFFAAGTETWFLCPRSLTLVENWLESPANPAATSVPRNVGTSGHVFGHGRFPRPPLWLAAGSSQPRPVWELWSACRKEASADWMVGFCRDIDRGHVGPLSPLRGPSPVIEVVVAGGVLLIILTVECVGSAKSFWSLTYTYKQAVAVFICLICMCKIAGRIVPLFIILNCNKRQDLLQNPGVSW